MRCSDCWSTPASAAAMRSSAVPNAPAAAQAEPPPGVGDAAENASSTSLRGLSAKATSQSGAGQKSAGSAGAEGQHFVLVLALILFADVVERVAQRLNRRLDRRLDVAALQLHAVDLALDVFEARLRLVEHELRAAFSLADDAIGFFLGRALEVLGQLLRRHQCRSQVLLVLPVLGQHGFHARQV